MPAPTLWLVRHAPTRDNVDAVIMGQRDPDAIVAGLDGADRLCQSLAGAAGAASIGAGNVVTLPAEMPRRAALLDDGREVG